MAGHELTTTEIPKIQKAAAKAGKSEDAKAPAKEIRVHNLEPH